MAARGRGAALDFAPRYPPPPDLASQRGALERLSRGLERDGPLGELYAARARELALDAELAENVGTGAFARLARRRHAEGTTQDWVAARRCATEWASAAAPDPVEPLTRSDDASAPNSLIRILGREIGRLRVPLRIEPSTSLLTRAATADGVIYVKRGVLLGRRAAERIALHELHGHALPRLAAREQAIALFRVGSAGANDDEEGRAVLLEERAELFDGERRRELGLRHVAALAVAEGAGAEDCVRLLEAAGCASEHAIDLYVRVARGGGLCREMEYLPAWQRVSSALASDPSLDRWLARGRLGLHAAIALRELGMPLV